MRYNLFENSLVNSFDKREKLCIYKFLGFLILWISFFATRWLLGVHITFFTIFIKKINSLSLLHYYIKPACTFWLALHFKVIISKKSIFFPLLFFLPRLSLIFFIHLYLLFDFMETLSVFSITLHLVHTLYHLIFIELIIFSKNFIKSRKIKITVIDNWNSDNTTILSLFLVYEVTFIL